MGIGGVETGVRNIAQYLNSKNIENYILCESNNKNLEDNNLNIIYLKNLKYKNIFDQTKIKTFIENFIKEKKINLIHISSRAPAFFLIKFLKKLNCKTVTSVHNKYKSENFLKSWYNNHLLKGDHVIFNSNFVKNSYEKFNLSKNKFTVVLRGVDIKYFQCQKQISLDHQNYIFMPSRISNWKGHDLLTYHYKKLPKKYKDKFKLLFISSHSTNEEIKLDKIIRENSLNSHINFTKPTLDIKRLYEKSFLTINMSKRPEGFGRTISESLSMSRPVIAPDCGGVKEQLEFFDTNLLFKVDSYNSFKKSLDYAINNHKRIQKKSRDFVKEKFSSNLMCKNTLKIYKNLIF